MGRCLQFALENQHNAIDIYAQISLSLSAILGLLQQLPPEPIVTPAPVPEVSPIGFAQWPIELQKTLICESGLRHYDRNGDVLKSPTNDYGFGQINLKSHLATSKNLGIDIFSLEGNLKYTYILFQEQGLKPWVCAKKLGYVR